MCFDLPGLIPDGGRGGLFHLRWVEGVDGQTERGKLRSKFFGFMLNAFFYSGYSMAGRFVSPVKMTLEMRSCAGM